MLAPRLGVITLGVTPSRQSRPFEVRSAATATSWSGLAAAGSALPEAEGGKMTNGRFGRAWTGRSAVVLGVLALVGRGVVLVMDRAPADAVRPFHETTTRSSTSVITASDA